MPLFGEVRPLAAADAEADFRTAIQPELAEFLRANAWTVEEAGFDRTFVLATNRKSANPHILGFYSLSVKTIERKSFPESDHGTFPFAVLPVAFLTYLAREDRVPRYRNTKLGEWLLLDALERVLMTSEDLGICGVILYAKNTRLEEYYAEYGFVKVDAVKRSKSNPSQLMFLRLSDLRETAAG
jgi:hypothetical protein